MSLFIETIRIEKGQIVAPEYHNQRMNRTRQSVFRRNDWLDVISFIRPQPYELRTKCRIEYGEDIVSVEYQPYRMRDINSLQLIRNDQIEYPYKSADRQAINRLFELRKGCDDVLIVKDKKITDTSICNVAFFDGTEWLTPEQPLLEGTARARLLDQNILKRSVIPEEMLSRFTHIRLFNAMIGFGEIELEVQRIYR